MDALQISDVNSTNRSEYKSKPEGRVTETCTCSCKCTYDFAVLHGDKDRDLAEKFFSVLEERYELKGYHSKRDCVVGVIKQRQLVKAWQDSCFIIELISVRSNKNKVFQKYRSIAHEVESRRTKGNHPEVLPIYVDIPPKEQRDLSTRVGRSFTDTDLFWDELGAHILNSHTCVHVVNSELSSVDSTQSDLSSEANVDLTNNNNDDDPYEKPPPIKCRKKHKIFRGLFQSKKQKLKSKLKGSGSYPKKVKSVKKKKSKKKKSKKNLKSFRKLLVCVPAKSFERSHSSPPVSSQSPSASHAPGSTAIADEVEHNFMDTASRMETTSEHDR